MSAIAEMAALREGFDFGKRFLGTFTGSSNVELAHARRIDDHAALGKVLELVMTVRPPPQL